jgi:pilus assembly protein CpaD
LASGDNTKEWNNLAYENYGCATQSMLAAQIDDPRDLARARAVTEPDVEMRLRAIDDVRKGTDPGTSWKIQNTAIGQVGGS